jgi:hypothetical protein
MADPSPQGGARAALIVFGQLALFLAGLTIFGFLVYWLRKSLG